MPGDRGGFVVPSQPRRPSRSVRVPGRTNGPVGLGHQPTGNLYVPLRGRTHTDDEVPQIPRGLALPPHEPDGGSEAESDPPEKSPAETSPADVTPADVRPADNSPAEAGQADANHADAQPSEKDPDPPEKDQDKAGPRPGSAGPPPRVPARQGPPPKPAPGNTSAVPAPRPGSAPATRPGSVPAARPGAAPAPRQAAGPPAGRPDAQPSWAAVLTTTFRLWARRRMEKTRWRALAGLVAAVLLFAAGALTATLI